MTFHSINCFANDGKLDSNELDKILDIALKDGVVDDNEKRVLSNIISRLTTKELNSKMKAKVDEIKSKHLS